MGFKRGSFKRGTVNGSGSKGRRTEHFNAQVTKQGFKQLASVVQSAADVTASQVLADKGSYRMSFDETKGTAIPTNVPGSGVLLLSGLGDNPVETEAEMQELSEQALQKMVAAFVDRIKESGL